MEPSRFRNGRLGLLLLLVVLAAADLASAQQNPPPPGFGGYPNSFSPSMAIVIVVLIAAFFFLGFFSVYIRHCYGDSYSNTGRLPVGTAAGAAARSRRQRGLDPAVLETFPTMAYADVKEHKEVKGALECAVCLSEFDDDETLRLLPKCSHVFHPDCIDTWLASHVTCPVCRANLVPDDPNAPAAADDDVAAELASDPSATEVPVPPTDAAPHVVINVEETDEERIIREETDELTRIGSVKRALRSKSSRGGPGRFPRSHSTGHSLAARAGTGTGRGAGAERFTLRLPDNVLREVVAAGKLRRTTSLIAFTSGRQGSTRRGLRIGGGGGGGEGSSNRGGRSVRLGQSGRWPSFLSRTFSAAWGSRSTRRVAESDGGSIKGGKPAGAGGKSMDCNDQACALGQHV